MKQYNLTTLQSCPQCGSSAISDFVKPKDFRATGDSFTIQKCGKCDFLFTNPRATGEELSFFYNSENYISHNNSDKGLFNKIYKTVRGFNLNRKLKLLQSHINSGRILDIGCGTGEFLNVCQSAKFETTGLEPAPLARSLAIQNHKLEVYHPDKLFELTVNSFSAVTMWHVLEHVENLEEYLKRIAELLKKDGVFIIAVPNCESHDANYYGKDWAAWDVPIHLSHFTKKTMSTWVEPFGFELLEIQNMIFDSFYVSILSEKNRNSSFAFPKGVVRGLISNLKASNKNASSLIYVFKKI